MNKNSYEVVGVMSGTSLDGIDLAHLHFRHDGQKWSFTIKEAVTIPYSHDWVAVLKTAIANDEEQLGELNRKYTALLGATIRDFISQNKIERLDAVCSHGHTILHNPSAGYTLQIGNLPQIAVISGQTVVCDFRVQDVQLGGQGAPLVPIGDRLLFSDYEYCLNLGGFSNISFEEDGKRRAFDISPVNTVLNHYAARLGLAYDDGGTIAASGHVDAALVEQLNALPFYAQAFPKSLGFEFVQQTVLPLMESAAISAQDKLATFTQHIALQIGKALQNRSSGTMLVTGGGAYNRFLINSIQVHLPHIRLEIPDAKTLEFKEALIFGLLGVLKLRGQVNVLSSVTGARHDHSAGVVFEKA